MFQVRMHGPGGQGVVTGAQMMSCVRSGRPGDDRPMVGPEACTEVRYFAHAKQMQALELIPQVAAKFRRVFERDSGGPIKSDRADDAQTIVIALGSVLGTFKDTVDALRAEGVSLGVIGITSLRPFPISALRDTTANAQRITSSWGCRSAAAGTAPTRYRRRRPRST